LQICFRPVQRTRLQILIIFSSKFLFSHPYKINPVVDEWDLQVPFHVVRSAGDFRSRFFTIFIVRYTIAISSRVVHSEYIFQLRNHARNGTCRSHWSTTGFILYGWLNKNFELNIINMWRHSLWRGRKNIWN
jgi:hypothetical protein